MKEGKFLFFQANMFGLRSYSLTGKWKSCLVVVCVCRVLVMNVVNRLVYMFILKILWSLWVQLLKAYLCISAVLNTDFIQLLVMTLF
jgi:hypothetical protein